LAKNDAAGSPKQRKSERPAAHDSQRSNCLHYKKNATAHTLQL